MDTSIEEGERERRSTPMMKESMAYLDKDPLELVLRNNRERKPAGTVKVMKTSKNKDEIMLSIEKDYENIKASGFGPNPRK